MLGLGCLLLGAAVLLFHSSGPNLVHLLAKYTRSPLVVFSYFKKKQRRGHKRSRPSCLNRKPKVCFITKGRDFIEGS